MLHITSYKQLCCLFYLESIDLCRSSNIARSTKERWIANSIILFVSYAVESSGEDCHNQSLIMLNFFHISTSQNISYAHFSLINIWYPALSTDHTSPLRLTQFKNWRKCCQTNSICLVSWLLRGSSTSSAEVIPTFSASQILILVDLPLFKCNWTTSIMHTSHGIATSTLVAFLWWASNNRNSSSQLLSSKQFLYRTEQERVRYPTYCRHVKSTSQYCPKASSERRWVHW